MLCPICVGFDVRELLLKAEAQPPRSFNDPSAPGTLESLRPAIPRFFKQHPTLISLRSSIGKCELCRCIWPLYSSGAHPDELTDEALGRGMGVWQIYIGTTAWDATLRLVACLTSPLYRMAKEGRRVPWLLSKYVRQEVCMVSSDNGTITERKM